MAHRIIDIMQDFTDRTTGVRSIMCEISADTASDLPSNTANLVYIVGSYATAIDTGRTYKINSSGNWIIQPNNDININIPDYDQLEDAVEQLQDDVTDIQGDIVTLQAKDVTLTDNKMDANFTPETSSPSISNGLRIRFAAPRSSNELTILVGKLNSTTNYVQFYINGVDKGYITFDVSRNIDVWSN